MKREIWKIYCLLLLLISTQQILIESFSPKNYANQVPKNHNSISQNAVRIIAAKWMNENPITGSLSINLNFDTPMGETAMFKRYYAGSRTIPSSKSFCSAVSAIGYAAGDVDNNKFTKYNPAYHFDGEKFTQSNNKIVENKLAAINFINKEQFDAARQKVGTALHILQDFYSHSNWVELGMSSINNNVGENSAYFSVASDTQATCSDCGSSTGSCSNNLNSILNYMNYLTSGYYRDLLHGAQTDDYGNEVNKPDGASKCSHGGLFDSSRTNSAIGGINKDTDIALFSPHSYLHNKAAYLALIASFDFLQRIREAVNDDSKFGRFLGIYQGSSLTFVIDTTGSMSPYIEGVKQSANQLINQWIADGNAASDFILVPFNDPDFGPLYRTSNSSLFKQWIAALYAYEGADEPEMCYSGLKLAVEAALPGTPIHLYTDASAKDKSLKDQVLLSAKLKSLPIFYYLGGVTARIAINGGRGMWDSWTDYTDVAFQTGGALFPQTSSSDDIAKVNKVIDSITSLQKVIIFKSMVTLNDTSQQNVSIPVDSTLATMNIIITGAISSIVINITEPVKASSATKNITTSTSVYNYMVTKPGTGQWTISIRSTVTTSSTISILAVGTSEFDARTRYVYYVNSSHAGFLEVQGNPTAGANLNLEVQSTSSLAIPSQVVFVDANTYKEIVSYALEDFDPDYSIYIANVTIPTQQYFVQVIGTTSVNNTRFSRLADQIITPARLILDASIQNGTTVLYQNQKLKINVSVTNLGSNSSFQVNVSSSSGAIQASISEATFNLVANSSKIILITLQVDSNATIGNTSNVILQVSSSRGDLNFYQVYFVIRSSKEVITDPILKITATNFNESCFGIKEQACLSSFWFSNITFRDNGSGISNFIIKELYGYNSTLIQTNNTNETYSQYKFSLKTDFNSTISQPNYEFKGYIKSSCCIQTAVTRTINIMGLCTSSVLGKALTTPDYYYVNTTDTLTSYSSSTSTSTKKAVTSTKVSVENTKKTNGGYQVILSQVTILFFQTIIFILKI